MSEETVAYDKADLRKIYAAFKAMDDEAVLQAKNVSNGLATYLKGKIEGVAGGANNRVSAIIAAGATVSKSSKTGDISFGFARQKLSGGGTTQQLWGGYEFGSNKFKQFPVWSGREGRGSRGWFIYPTLRAEQPAIVAQWEDAFSKILKEW
jgi:hypothetical protein